MGESTCTPPNGTGVPTAIQMWPWSYTPEAGSSPLIMMSFFPGEAREVLYLPDGVPLFGRFCTEGDEVRYLVLCDLILDTT